jgi:S-adenosyl methyltransferase
VPAVRLTEPPASCDWPVLGTVDTTTPAPARVYDYLLGGKDNFAADRAVGDRLTSNVPQAVRLARDNRHFLHRAVRLMVANGITQFLDIGPGFPAAPTTDEIALKAEPRASVVYVDNDPVVISHTRALIRSTRVGAVHRDVREPHLIFESPEVRSLIDLSRPVGLLLVAILHFLPKDEDLDHLAAALRSRLPRGSHLAVSHVTSTGTAPEWQDAVVGSWPPDSPSRPVFRTANEISRVFGDWRLVEPGLVDVADWQPGGNKRFRTRPTVRCLGGVAIAR